MLVSYNIFSAVNCFYEAIGFCIKSLILFFFLSLADDDLEVKIGGINCPIKSSSALEIVCVTESRPEGTIKTKVYRYLLFNLLKVNIRRRF